MHRRHGRGQLEWRVVELKGRAEIHRRTLRRLHRDMRLATRWIENGFNIPLVILVDLHPAFRTQRVTHTLAHARRLSW